MNPMTVIDDTIIYITSELGLIQRLGNEPHITPEDALRHVACTIYLTEILSKLLVAKE